MADSKAIELAIKANDLASKPLAEIGAAVDKLVSAVAELAPASQKGEKNLSEMTATVVQLQKALAGLKANAGILETFKLLSAQVAEASTKMDALRSAADSAKVALSNAAEPTRAMEKAADAAASAAKRQETALVSLNTKLETLREKARVAGVDLTDLAKAQSQVDAAFAAALPARDAMNNAIAAYSANQRKATAETKLAADAAAAQAVQEKQAAQAQAEVAAKTQAAAQKKIAADEASAAAFKKEVLAAEQARAKDVELAFAEQEAAQASLKKAAAQELAAKAATELAAKTKLEAEAAGQSAAMEERFTAALRQQGTAAEGAAHAHGSLLNSFALFRDEGRTTLSLYQRIRGEVLSMTAEFVGFYGAIEAVKSGFEALENLEGSTSILKSTFGEDSGKQLEYVRGQADRLGLAYVELTKSYAKFTAAASGSGTSNDQQRAIFETFAEAARVKELSAEQINGVFQALDKIMAKDAVGATELFRKLTTDLPDAAAAFRKSIGTADGQGLSEDEFQRLLKSGKITSEFLVSFAAEYRKTFAEQLPEATKGTSAELERFGNAWTEFKIQILESGALQAFRDALAKLTVYFRSDDGKHFAEQLGMALKLVAQGLGLVVDHIDEIKGSLEILAVLWAANIGKSFLVDLKKLYDGFQHLNMGIEAMTKGATGSVATLGKAFGLVGAFFAGYDFGTWLYNNSAGVRQFGAVLVGSFMLLFQKIGDLASLMWAKVFHPDNVEALKASQAKLFAAAQANFADTVKSAGKPLGGDGSSGTPEQRAAGSAVPTATVVTPEQQAAALKAALDAQKEELETAAKGISTRLSEMRGELMRKDATDLKSYLAGLALSFAPLYAQIDKLKQDFPHNSQALVDKLTGQLNSIKALTLADAGNKFNEDKAKRDLQDINTMLRERNVLIQNEQRKAGNGSQSQEQATSNIAGINTAANAEMLQKITQLQSFLASLPASVQTKLKQTANELKIVLDELTDRPATNVLKDIKSQEEEINQALELRNVKLEAIKQQQSAGLLTTQQTKDAQVAINGQFDMTIKKAQELIVYIQTTKDLTDDQRKALETTVAKLQIMIAGAKQFTNALYPAKNVAQDIASGLTGVAKAFAKAAVQGKGLGGAFTSAWVAFKAFAADFLMKIAEMILQQTLLNALTGSGGGAGISGGISSWVTGIMGLGGSAAGASAADSSLGNAILAGVSHMGGMAGAMGASRHVSPAWFEGARRMHMGGIAGLKPDEVPTILQHGEEVLSRSNPRNAANGGGQPSTQHIQVINGIDHESIVRQGLNAPSNTKVILNLIRANKGAVRTALA